MKSSPISNSGILFFGKNKNFNLCYFSTMDFFSLYLPILTYFFLYFVQCLGLWIILLALFFHSSIFWSKYDPCILRNTFLSPIAYLFYLFCYLFYISIFFYLFIIFCIIIIYIYICVMCIFRHRYITISFFFYVI